MQKKIQIYLAYHKATPILSTDIFTPIQGGRAIASKKLDMIGDDTGDNISAKNRNFCEMTVQYWIWKNSTADYVGLCHYRRIPSFTDCSDDWFQDYSQETCDRFGWNRKTIEKLLDKYDILLPCLWDTHSVGEPGNFQSLYDYYCKTYRKSDLDTLLDIIREKTPEVAKYIPEIYFTIRKNTWRNIAIMPKKLYDAYSEWIFTVLFELEKRITLPKDKESARLFGFLGENLMNLWVAYAKDKYGARVWYAKNLPIMRYEDADTSLDTKVLASPMEYVENPILSVM